MSRLLTSHRARFTEDGLFFYALLGLVALGDRAAQFVAEPKVESPPDAASAREPHFEREPGVDTVTLCFLGMLCMRQRITSMITHWAAQGTPPQPVPSAPAFLADLLQ